MAYIFYTDQGMGKYFELPSDRMVVFGREEHTDFQILNDSEVSREHFCVKRDEEGCYVLIDLGSRNGTFVNGAKLQNETFNLRHDDEIRAGKQLFTFKTRRETQAQSAHRIITQIQSSMDEGKGYKTLLREIVEEKK